MSTEVARVLEHSFTAHNIDLPDGSRTFGDGGQLLRESAVCRAIMRSLRLICPPGADPPLRVVDLGCLEGGYAVEFARAGYDTLGIEGRQANVVKCEAVADALKLPNLKFAHDDVRNLERYGDFDAVFCSGLLYHLDRPVSFLQLLGRVTKRLLILQTHYALEGEHPEHSLSGMTRHEGKLGRWYHEWDPGMDPEQVEQLLWASVNNSASFWLEKKHLLQSIVESGFAVVYEQFDFLTHIVEDPYHETEWRSTFVAVKEPAHTS